MILMFGLLEENRRRGRKKMEGEENQEIGLALARSSELRSKINNCIIHRATRKFDAGEGEVDLPSNVDERGGEEEEEEEESLLDIRDALESLEQQLASLQAMQQQQSYEREVMLSQIDCSRRSLLSKLKEYKGEELEVIHEASTFAGGTVEHDDDLLLPPYPSNLPDTFVLDGLYSSAHFFKRKSSSNGLTGGSMHGTKKIVDVSLQKESEPVTRDTSKGLRSVFAFVAKSALTVAGVVSVLSLAGFNPRLQRRDAQFKLSELFHKSEGEEETSPSTQCSPGKVLVIEDGESRCVVKERIEIPFDSVVKDPNVSYGLG